VKRRNGDDRHDAPPEAESPAPPDEPKEETGMAGVDTPPLSPLSREEVEAHRKNDPVPRFERLLVEQGILTEAGLDALKQSVLKEANEATDAAEAMPYADPATLTDNVYADGHAPWR